MSKTQKRNTFIAIPIVLIIGIWVFYMLENNSWGLFKDFWFMSVTMVFGSFIAGASEEGGGGCFSFVGTHLKNPRPEIV